MLAFSFPMRGQLSKDSSSSGVAKMIPSFRSDEEGAR
jgi:hypothetical protein